MDTALKQNSLFLSFFVWFIIAVTPMGNLLESTMIGHILVEVPLLLIVGVVIGLSTKEKIAPALKLFNHGGITGILMVTFVLGFWMIPRWLDASLSNDTIGLVKYFSLTLGAGVPLAWSWAALHPIARAVVKIEFLSMLFRLGWIYIISPNRLCNNYRLNEQELLGQGFLIIGFSLSITWLVPVFFTDKISH